ncbi:hypothetical protein RDWZM_003668 [Blomia tropicalis]|uniref:Major facilitator superfamily (MFS) profile domain-containing protein n=1 Tax=Blomia tropicalis TaxID=40697 RepID=A0A9Q0MFG4_BLOTA|nr:hypothetical protein RDWZM_003668 [Blomia tropicalis]
MYACGLLFAQRAAMSVAIVAMTRGIETESESMKKVNNQIYHCGKSNQTDTVLQMNQFTNESISLSTINHGEFDWNQKLQGVILGSIFYLYCIVPLFAGRLTDSIGPKWITFVGLLFPCLLNAIIPFSVRLAGANALIVIQTLIGGFHGCIYPSLFSINLKWFSPNERANANAGIIAGGSFGNSIAYLISGYLSQSSIGWPLVFYVLSLLHVPWLILWLYFITNDPMKNKHVSDKELIFIKENVPPKKVRSKVRPPWLRIMSSPTVLGSIITKCANSFGFFMLTSKMPSFLYTIFGVPIVKNGMFSALATSSTGVSSIIASILANRLITRYQIRSIIVRKLMQALSMIGPALALITITLLECDINSIIIIIFTGMFLYGFVTGGEFTIVSDFAPNFAGTVVGVIFFLPFVQGILAPYLVGFVLDYDAPLSLNEKWNIIFYFTAGLYILGMITFILTADDKQQDWDKEANAKMSKPNVQQISMNTEEE